MIPLTESLGVEIASRSTASVEAMAFIAIDHQVRSLNIIGALRNLDFYLLGGLVSWFRPGGRWSSALG